jgi:hypothetical protein
MKNGILQTGCAGNQKCYISDKLRNIIHNFFLADVLIYAIVPVFPKKIKKTGHVSSIRRFRLVLSRGQTNYGSKFNTVT